MSANELLHEIEALSDDQRRWLMEKLNLMGVEEQSRWALFSATQMASQYSTEDSVYDEE